MERDVVPEPRDPAEDISRRRPSRVRRAHAAERHRTQVRARNQNRVQLRRENREEDERERHDEEVAEPVPARPEVRQVVRVRLVREATIDRPEGDDAYHADDDYNGALNSGCQSARVQNEDVECARECRDS